MIVIVLIIIHMNFKSPIPPPGANPAACMRGKNREPQKNQAARARRHAMAFEDDNDDELLRYSFKT